MVTRSRISLCIIQALISLASATSLRPSRAKKLHRSTPFPSRNLGPRPKSFEVSCRECSGRFCLSSFPPRANLNTIDDIKFSGCSMSNQGYNILGAVAGVVGMLAAVPLLYTLICSQLPSTKLQYLEKALGDTESLLRSVTEEGLLRDTKQLHQFGNRLTTLRTKGEKYRDLTYLQATTFWKEVRAWLSGLSGEISVIYHEVVALRAKISKTSTEARQRLQSVHGLDLQRERSRFAWLWDFVAVIQNLLTRTWGILAGCCTATNDATPSLTGSPSATQIRPSADRKPHLVARSRKARIRALLRVAHRVDQELSNFGISYHALFDIAQKGRQKILFGSNKRAHGRQKLPDSRVAVSPATSVEHTALILPRCTIPTGTIYDDQCSKE